MIKTLCIAQPHLQHLYRSSQPDDVENSLCCQILGFDVMLDHCLRAQLLEVNQSPSFTTDSPLDYRIKKALIMDTMRLWNLSIKRKLRSKGDKRAQMQKRLLSYQPGGEKAGGPVKEKGKQGAYRQQVLDEREALRKKRMLQREKYEKANCGGYRLIYPLVGYQEEFDEGKKEENKEDKEEQEDDEERPWAR